MTIGTRLNKESNNIQNGNGYNNDIRDINDYYSNDSNKNKDDNDYDNSISDNDDNNNVM